MSILQGLEWSMYLIPMIFQKLDGMMITGDVSVMAFSVACILLTYIIGAIVLRV